MRHVTCKERRCGRFELACEIMRNALLSLLPGPLLGLLLPSPARPHAAQAEQHLLSGAPAARVLEHVETAVSLSNGDVDGVSDLYKRLLRLSRKRDASLSLALVEHLYASELDIADAAVAHLAVSDLVGRGRVDDARGVLASFHARRLPLSAGSFDMLIQHAAKRRDRGDAYAAYRLLRRCRVRPTAYTLNALLNVEVRCDRPLVALRLLQRAERGAPRWPGASPDAWSYSTAMYAAKQAGRWATVAQLYGRQVRDPKLRGRVSAVARNLAIEARLRQGDEAGAVRIYEAMLRGEHGAPTPQADTYNVMLSTLGERGEPFLCACSTPSDGRRGGE